MGLNVSRQVWKICLQFYKNVKYPFAITIGGHQLVSTSIKQPILWWRTTPPSVAYMRRWTGWALFQIMAFRLDGAKPISEPMLSYCQLDPHQHVLMKFYLKVNYSHSRKCDWTSYRSVKWWPFFFQWGEELHVSVQQEWRSMPWLPCGAKPSAADICLWLIHGTLGPILQAWINFNPSMNNHISNKMWNEIIYPFPNFIMDVITYSCWDYI